MVKQECGSVWLAKYIQLQPTPPPQQLANQQSMSDKSGDEILKADSLINCWNLWDNMKVSANHRSALLWGSEIPTVTAVGSQKLPKLKHYILVWLQINQTSIPYTEGYESSLYNKHGWVYKQHIDWADKEV